MGEKLSDLGRGPFDALSIHLTTTANYFYICNVNSNNSILGVRMRNLRVLLPTSMKPGEGIYRGTDDSQGSVLRARR